MYSLCAITSFPSVTHSKSWRLFKNLNFILATFLNRILQPTEHNRVYKRRVVGMNRYSCLLEKKALEQHMKREKAHFCVFVQTMTKHWLEVLPERRGRSPVRGADTPQQMSLAFYGIRSDPEMGGVRGSTEVSPFLLTLINESVLSLTLFFVYLYFSLLRFCKFALCFFFFLSSFLFRMIFLLLLL